MREDDRGCTSIFYSSLDSPYSRICGQIRAYKIGTPDGFRWQPVNRNYLDGVSITLSTSTSKTHVWSFAAGRLSCTDNKPSFIGNNFACDMSPYYPLETLCEPLLWKSQQYGTNVSSWLKELLFPLVSDIEVRVCRDQMRFDEDLAITTLEFYVQ